MRAGSGETLQAIHASLVCRQHSPTLSGAKRHSLAERAGAGGSREFAQWNFPHLSSGSGVAANPIRVPLARHLRFLVDFAASCSEEPRFLIESNVPGTWVQVNGAWRILPWSFPVSRYADGVTVQALETHPEAVSFGASVRDRFDNWSDGGDPGHALDVPETGGQLRLDLRREYRLRTAARNRWDDGVAIEASPPSEDGMYAAGTQVTLTAVPEHGGCLAGWTGDASGRGSVQTVAMDAARSVEAIFTRSQPLVPGAARDVSLSASSQNRLCSGGEGCNVLVPPDAARLTVAFESSIVGAEFDLYVRRGLEVRAGEREAGAKPRIAADHESASPGAGERIDIERGDNPPLTNDTCRIGLGVPSSEVDIRGTLAVRIQRSGIAAATPGALASVSPEGLSPPRQAVRLDHNATGSFRYRIESNQSWLAASPREWVRTQRGTTEIAVTVDSAGLSLATHPGRLAVVKVDDRDATAGGTATGIEIPVAFAVVPAGGSAGEERNAVSIASYPGNADSCGAGECIRLGVRFTEPVVVSGIPTLALTMESGERLAAWTGSTRSRCGGDWTLGFRGRADDSAPGGSAIASDALAPSGGSIRTAAGTEAKLAVVSDPGRDAKHKVNGRRAPEVESVRIISRPRNGSACGTGEAIDIPVTFDLRSRRLELPRCCWQWGTPIAMPVCTDSNATECGSAASCKRRTGIRTESPSQAPSCFSMEGTSEASPEPIRSEIPAVLPSLALGATRWTAARPLLRRFAACGSSEVRTTARPAERASPSTHGSISTSLSR